MSERNTEPVAGEHPTPLSSYVDSIRADAKAAIEHITELLAGETKRANEMRDVIDEAHAVIDRTGLVGTRSVSHDGLVERVTKLANAGLPGHITHAASEALEAALRAMRAAAQGQRDEIRFLRENCSAEDVKKADAALAKHRADFEVGES